MLKHRLTAWNTGGEGIHSPRLFYMVRHLFYDTSQLYAWHEIELRRQAMLRAPKLLHIQDFGTGKDRDELVQTIARRSVMERKYAKLLARIVHYMSGNEYVPDRHRPLNIIELGTSLGLTTAYLALVDSSNQVITLEGCQAIADMAKLNWEKLHVDNITNVIGPIDDTLYKYAHDAREQLDFVLMDANHTKDATLRYLDWLIPMMDKDGIIAVDDIRYSTSMYQAWRQACTRKEVSASMDLGQMGLLFFNTQLQRKMYKIRL